MLQTLPLNHKLAGSDSQLDGAHPEELCSAGDVFEIPKGSTTHRVKYLGTVAVNSESSKDCQHALLDLLASDSTDMSKHTKEKTLQHVIDYAPDTVLVVAKDGIRVLNSTTMEVQSNVITNTVKTMNLVELEKLLVESNMVAIQNSEGLRRSKSPVKRAKPQTDTSGLQYPQLSLEQNTAIQKRVDSGDLDEVAAIKEAQDIMAEVRDRAVCMVFKDELADQLKCEVFIVKGSVKKAGLITKEIKLAIGMSNNQEDPFAATSKMQKTAISPMLGAVEISRSDIMAVKMVGSGMFGEVFLANEYEHAVGGAVTETRRAVKTLRKGSNKKQRKEFCDEAAIQLEFKHKGLVEVTGVCMMQEPYLCVLEFMQFGDLQNVLQTLDDKAIELEHHEQMHGNFDVILGPFFHACSAPSHPQTRRVTCATPLRYNPLGAHADRVLIGPCHPMLRPIHVFRYILLQISDALKYMHDRRYVHMDLATRNILVGADTRIKVADFGLTRKYDADKSGYRLTGRMKLPMLWTPPECFPPIVTCGVNRAASGVEVPFYSEKTDMWSYGVCIWEIATYGGTPYGKGGKLIETLKKVHEGARLELPEGTRKGIVNLMNFAFSDERNNRPSFGMVSEVLQNEFQRSGAPGVRDIGNLINDGFEKRIQRQSAIVGTIRRKASMTRNTGVAPKLADVSKELAGMGAIGEEEEPIEEEDVDIDDAIAADKAASAPKRPKSMASKWRKLRIMLPFFQMNTWVVTLGGKMERTVDESKLTDALDHHDVVENAFDSDDSDESEDETPVDIIPTVVEEGEEEPAGPRGFPRMSSDFPEEDGFEGLDGSEPSTPADDGDDGDGEDGPPASASAAMMRGGNFKSAFVAPLHIVEESDDDDEDEDEDDGAVDDMDILELMAKRRAQNAEAEVARAAEIKAQYEKRRAEEERILAIELAQFEVIKKREHAVEEAEKEKLYQDAQARLATELTFSFSWG